MVGDAAIDGASENGSSSHLPGVGDCWNTIGVSGDRSCPELNTHIHCRSCPVFAAAARASLTGVLQTVISRSGRSGWLNQRASVCVARDPRLRVNSSWRKAKRSAC